MAGCKARDAIRSLLHDGLQRRGVRDPLDEADPLRQRHDGVRPQPRPGPRQRAVHHGEQLLDALVKPQVLPALHQEGVDVLIAAVHPQPLGPLDGGHCEQVGIHRPANPSKTISSPTGLQNKACLPAIIANAL